MGRHSTLIKTSKPNIYETVSKEGNKEFLATWTQDGRRYVQKNLTRLFGCTTLTQASRTLNEIKVLLSRGENPFPQKEEKSRIRTLREHVLEEIADRNASETYKYIQRKVFLKHVDPVIGHVELDKLGVDDILLLFRKLKKSEKDETLTNVKKTLNPTLDIAVDEGLLERNPLQSKKVKKLTKKSGKSGKQPLKHRLSGEDDLRYLEVGRLFYDAAIDVSAKDLKPRGKIPDRELQLAFLFVLMTARRRGEILSLHYEDVTRYGTVKSRQETTKTDVWEEYPLPDEILERLDPKGSGPIFRSLKEKTYSEYIRIFIDRLDLPLHRKSNFWGHDTRHLFLTLMSKVTRNPFLCDSAISHAESKKQYQMLHTYYEPDLKDYRDLFEQYWELLRGNRDLPPR